MHAIAIVLISASMLMTATTVSAGESNTLANAAHADYEEGNFASAVVKFEQALERSPQSPQLHQWLGRSYGRLAEQADWLSAWNLAVKARTSFEQAASLAPSDPQILSDLMKFYATAPNLLGGNLSKAQHLANRVAALDPREGIKARDWLAANAGS